MRCLVLVYKSHNLIKKGKYEEIYSVPGFVVFYFPFNSDQLKEGEKTVALEQVHPLSPARACIWNAR